MEPAGDTSDSKAEVEKMKPKTLILCQLLAATFVLVGDRQLEVSCRSLKLFSLIIWNWRAVKLGSSAALSLLTLASICYGFSFASPRSGDMGATSDTVWPQEELQPDTVSLVRQATPEIRRLNLGHRTEQEPEGQTEGGSELSKHYARACGQVTLLKKEHSGGELFLHLLWWSLNSSRALFSFLNFPTTSSSYLHISLTRASLPALLSVSAWAFTFLYF